MFEHLGYTPETIKNQIKTKWRVYVGAFLVAFIFLVVSLVFSRSPQTVAETSGQLTARIEVNNQAQLVVASSPQLSLFDFVIFANWPEVRLKRLRVYLNGLYEPEILQNLKLYHNGAQVGQLSKFDGDGYIYFETDNYQLSQGANLFSITLAGSEAEVSNKILQLSFEQPEDINLSYQSHLFMPEGNFPLRGGHISFVKKGNLAASNNLKDLTWPVLNQVPNPVAYFSLVGRAETIDVKKIILNYQSDQDLQGESFALLYNNQLLATTEVLDKDEGIIFSLTQPLVLNKDRAAVLQVHSLGLPKGVFNFSLGGVEALGSLSGLSVNLDQPLALSQVESLSYYPEFSTGVLKKVLVEGWNELYDLQIKAEGEATLNLDKLTWSIIARGADIITIEVWVNNKLASLKSYFSNNKLIINNDKNNPLIITENGLDIKILAKITNLTKGAIIQTRLLSDDQLKLDSNLDYNILWSKDKEVFNSYNLPYLPLVPSVLTASDF
jgi:hypothetical protein